MKTFEDLSVSDMCHTWTTQSIQSCVVSLSTYKTHNKNTKGFRCFHNLVLFCLGLRSGEGGLVCAANLGQFTISHKEIL